MSLVTTKFDPLIIIFIHLQYIYGFLKALVHENCVLLLCPNINLYTDADRYALRCNNSGIRLKKSHPRSNILKYSFSNRITVSWNSLPENICKALNFSTSKARLKKFLSQSAK